MHFDGIYFGWVIFCSASFFFAESSYFSLDGIGSLVSGCWVGNVVVRARKVSVQLIALWNMSSLLFAKTPQVFHAFSSCLNNDQVSAHFKEEGKNAR